MSLILSRIDTTACPGDFEDFGDGTTVGPCLYFVRSKASWSDHRQICQALGGDLAKLTGELHQDVVDYINSQPGEKKHSGLVLARYFFFSFLSRLFCLFNLFHFLFFFLFFFYFVVFIVFINT